MKRITFKIIELSCVLCGSNCFFTAADDIIDTQNKLLLKWESDPKQFFNLINHLQSSSYLLCCSLKPPTPFCVNEQLVPYSYNNGIASSVYMLSHPRIPHITNSNSEMNDHNSSNDVINCTHKLQACWKDK